MFFTVAKAVADSSKLSTVVCILGDITIHLKGILIIE